MAEILPFPARQLDPDELLRSCIQLAIVADLNEPAIARRLRALTDSFSRMDRRNKHCLVAAAAAIRARYGSDNSMVRHLTQAIVA
jgi:hypothetical protein